VRLNETLAAINGSTVAEQVGQLVSTVVPDLWPLLEGLYRQVLDRARPSSIGGRDPGALGPDRESAMADELLPGPTQRRDHRDRDRSRRHHLERVRRAAETRFEIGFEQAAIGAVISDLDGLPTRVNSAVCDILGRPADQLIGRRWTEYSHPDDTALGIQVLKRIDEGHDSYQDERRYVRPMASSSGH